jgi:outer membrane protein TolC
MNRLFATLARAGKAGWALLFFMSGCAVGPNYVRPAADLAPFHNLAAVENRPATRPPPALDRWWTGFDDPELVTIVQRALDQNLDLQAALARVLQARAVAAAAGAQLLPTADLNASANAGHQSLNGPFGSIGRNFPGFTRDEHEYTLGPAASWEIDLFGGLRRGAAAAHEEADAAEAERAGVRITVTARLSGAAGGGPEPGRHRRASLEPGAGSSPGGRGRWARDRPGRGARKAGARQPAAPEDRS